MNLLTIKEAARILKVSEKTLRRWEEKSYITPIRTSGKHRRYSLEQLKEVKKNKNKIKSEVAPITVSTPIETKNIGVSNFDNIFKDIEDSKEDVLPKPRTGFRYKLLLSYFVLAAFVFGSFAVYKNARILGINSELSNETGSLSDSSNQSVLAATSFQNAEFNVNVPTIFSSSVTVGTDTFTNITGNGLTVVNGALTAINTNTLGADVNSAEIVDGTISEVDLLSSNTPSGSQILSFNPTTGGFTWTNQITDTDTVGTNFFTDSGDITYLTSTTDDFAIGGSAATSPFYFDSSAGTINLTKTAAGKWINFSDGTDVWGLYNYAGSPEGNITANTGTLAMDTANGTLYVKTDDSDATGWVNLATGATSPFVQAAGLITLTTTTDNTNFGGSTDLAKLAVDGDTDEIQLLIQGNSTQTSNVVVFENSSGVDLLALSNSGGLTIGSNGVDGTLTLYSEQGATDYSTVFVPGTQTENITYTLPADNGAGANYVLSTDGTGVLSWQSVSGIGGMSSFVLSGDSGSSQTISDSNTLLISGGVNGIDTTTSATDAITLDIDTTEIGENTFGNNTDASIVWTFDQTGVTDPTLTFGDGLISVGGDLAISGGNVTTAVTFDGTLTATGTTTTNGSLVANGSTTLGDGGDTVVINSSDWDISAVGDLTGVGNVTIDGRFDTAAHSNNTGLNLPTSAGAPIAVTGTSEGDIVYDTTNDSLYIYDGGSFTAIGGGGYSGWTLAGDTGTPEAISSGNTGNILGGVNGIDTVVSATDTITLNFDATEVGSVTFGSGSAITWTFDASAGTDPTLVFGDNTATLTAGTISLAGNTDITNGADVTGGDLTVGGANFNVAVGSGNITTVGTVSSNVNESINGIDINAGTVSDIVNLTINSGGDLTIGAIGLNDVGTTNITSGASLIGAFDEFTNSASTTVQDVLDDLDAAIGAGASKFTQDTGFIYLTTTTDSVTIGGTTELGKLAVDGNADEIQLLIQGNGTQTANLAVFENSAGTDQLVLTNTGDLTINGDLAISGGNITSSITFDSDVDLSLAGTENFVITSGAPGADLAVISGGTSTTDGVDGLQLTYGVSAASGNIIDLTPSYADATAVGTSETYNVIDIDAFTATQNAAGDTGLIRAVNIGNLTQTETAGTLTANAIKIGTGWDDILNYNGTTVINGTGQIVSTQLTGTLFTLAGDSGSGTVAQGDTITVAGGTNGIDTSESGTTVTLNIDATEIGTTTFGSGSGITWTYDASAGTDTTIAFGDNTQIFTTGTATFTGAVAINGNSLTVGSNGTDGALTLFSEMGATDYSVVFQPSNSQTQATTYTLPIAYAGANDYVLTSDTSGVLSWQQVTAVGGAGDITTVGDITSGAAFTQTAGNDGNTLYFEGTTVDGNEIALTGGDSGSDIVVTIPAIAGTLASLSGTQVFDGIKSFTDAAGITIGLDTATNTAGLLKLISAGANAFSTIFTTGTQTQDVTYTLPLNDGNSDQALVTDGAGVLIWKDIAGVGGVGDITNVGNVTSGEAFTSGTPGTSLYFATGGDINDANGNEVLTFTTTTSAVNELTLANAAANGNITLSATGGDTDIDIETILKGTGTSIFSSSTTNADKIAIKPQTTTAVSSFTGTITTLNLTGDRTYTLKDADGTIAFTSDIPTSDNYVSWTIDGDDADTEAIGSGNTLLVAGGTNGIDTDVSATDTITLNFDTTEVGTSTFGSGAGIVWTFDIGTTDPTLTFGEGLVTVGGDLAISGGNVTTAVTFDSTATVTGTTTTNGTLTANGAVTLGDNGDTVVINSSDWDINATGDATGIGAITADGAISFTPSTTNDITFNVDTDTLLTLDSSVANADNLVVSPNNSGTGATFTGTVTSANLTADRTWTFQDGDGTIAFLTDIPTSDNYVSWTLAGDTGTPEAIASGNTGSILGGINGIDTAVGATDTLTINLDTTEIGTTTFGSGSGITWTFDIGTTDPTLTFGEGLVTVGGDLAISGGNVTTAVTFDSTATVTGTSTLNGLTTVNDDFTVALTGNENVEITDGATPTTDTLSLVSNGATVTTGVNAAQIDFTTGDGTDAANSGLEINMASGGTGAGDITNAINLTMDAADASTQKGVNFADNNFDTDINATTDLTLGIGGTNELTLTAASLSPSTSDGNALGTGSLMWSDLFLASGAVINFNNSDVLITHSTDALSFTGGDYNFDGIDGQSTNIDGDGSPTADVLVLGASDIVATDGVDALAISFAAADGTNLTNSAINISLTSNGTASGDLMRGLFIDLASVANAASTNKAIEIENTTAWDVDIELQNDETIDNVTDSKFTFSTNTTNADKLVLAPNVTASANTFAGTLTTLDLTADRTYTLKDADGTIAFTSDIPTSDNYQYWTIDGDDVDTEQIGSTNTLLVAGGTNGIDTDVSATDTITLNFDTTEVGTSTFGSGSAITWTFDASAGTDPTITFGSDLVTVGNGLTVTGTTTTNGTLTANGQSTFNPSGTNDITFGVDTDTLLTLDSTVANADNLVVSPNNSGTGATFTGTVTSANLTADRTWTFQDGDGTIAFLTDIPTSDNYVSWTLAGDTGTPEAIASGNTGSILGGINGIDTAVGATDTLTINLDTTEIGTTTFGSGSSVVWTFDASAGTDTTITFGDNLITLGQGLTTTGILTANGIVTLGDNGDTVNINSSDWDISTTGDATGMGSITGDGDLVMTGGDFTGANSETLDMGETDNGSFIFTAAGETNNESIEFDLETAANTLSIFSSTGITSIDLGSSIFLTNIGNAGTDFTATGGLTLDDILTVNDDADIAFTGDENLTITDGATPTVDVISIVANGATVTTDANGIELDFTTGDGANVTNSGLQIDMASGGTASGDITNAINLTMDALDASTQKGLNFADNNFDTDINATTDLTLGIGGTNEITLTGTNLAPSTAEGNSLGSATLEWEEVFVGDDAGIKFGLDQDWTMAYDQAGDSRLELTTAGTSGMLIQTANATGTSLNLTTNSLTTGTGFLVDNSANTLTTGTLIQAQSTGTSLTTAADAFLGYFDWTPGSATTATGDLFRINIGANGNVTNVFNVTDAGSSLFRVSESQIESAVPHLFSAVGDVNIAYDLIFTNQTSSTIDSYGPLTLRAGESFESNNLTLTSYLNGNILLNTGATTGKVGVGAGITPLGLLTVDSTGTGAIGKAALTVIQDESQDIITASASATTRFTVNSAGNTFVTLRNTATSAVCHVTNGAGYDELTDCLTSVLADYAERYPVANDITYGEIVATGSENVTTTDGQTIKKLVKSNSAYQNNVLGITSDNYGDFTSAGNNINENDNPMPVALSGRVPVKVANSSEPIVSGDFITSSIEEGKAMKATGAGKVIGIALEDWAPNQGKETAMVYVSNFYYTPAPENAVSRDEIENLLRITEQNQVLLEESQNWNTNTATTSGEFSDLVTSNLFVTGIAAFDSLSLTNSLTLNNNLVIGDGNIDSLTTPLNIQGSGAQALNFMAGKVTIDTNGNMVVQGDLKVLGTLDANKVSVSEDVAGTATIVAGANEIIISNENIKTDSLIFVTPTSPTKNSIYVKTQVEGQATIGFDPIIVDEIEIPTVSDIKFNWWIVGKSQ